MKKTCFLPVTLPDRHQKPIHLKVQTGLLLFLFAGLFVLPVFSQKVCDTLYTTNGVKTLIELIHTYKHGIVYTKCEEHKGFRYYTISDEILAIRYQNPEMHKALSISKKKAIEANRHRKTIGRVQQGAAGLDKVDGYRPDLYVPQFNKHSRIIFWAALDLVNPIVYGNYSIAFPVQFGIEMSFPDHSIRLGLNYQPYYLKGAHRKDGTGMEIGLVAKKFSVGRLSGLTKAGYWGMDVRVGQQPFTPDDPLRSSINYSWLKIMPCIGLQYSFGLVAIDARLPIGVEFLSANGTNYYQHWEDIASEPTLSVGLRF